jgi:hypothetical protein
VTDAEDRAYLSSLSQHPGRPYDVSEMHPAMASRLAGAMRDAIAQGIPVRLLSGVRRESDHPSAYDVSGKSSHLYGGAGDVTGIGAAGSPTAKQWYDIATSHGLYNPYGYQHPSEFNHFQLTPQPLETTPQLLASLTQARATGNPQNVWNAYAQVQQPAQQMMASQQQQPAFAMPANAPPGMRNNNPLNIKYFPGAERTYAGVLGPSVNTDQGTPQIRFASPEAGWAAGYALLKKKYDAGRLTPNDIIAADGGWTGGNWGAARHVAQLAGLRPDQNINFNDPASAARFMRALVVQEQGEAGKAYSPVMIQAAIEGKSAGTASGAGGTTSSTAVAAAAPAATPSGTPTVVAAQPSPWANLGASLASSFGGGGSSSSVVTDTSQDAHPVTLPMPAPSQAPNALPLEYQQGHPGLGAQLGQLASQPIGDAVIGGITPDSITAGAPGMTQLLGAIGTSADFNYLDPRAAQPVPTTMKRPRLA